MRINTLQAFEYVVLKQVFKLFPALRGQKQNKKGKRNDVELLLEFADIIQKIRDCSVLISTTLKHEV